MCNLFELAFALVSLRFARYTVLTSPNKDETAVHCYGPTFIGSCRVGVSQSHFFLRSISLAVMFVFPEVCRNFNKFRSALCEQANNKWQSLQHRRRRIGRLGLLHKAVHNEAAITFPPHVQHKASSANRNSHPLKFIPVQTSCDAYKFSLFNDLNSLPRNILDVDSTDSFKIAVNAFLTSSG